MADEIEITVEEDGTISTKVGKIGPTNHQNAEEFLRCLSELMGGKVTVKRDSPHAHHTHKAPQKIRAGR